MIHLIWAEDEFLAGELAGRILGDSASEALHLHGEPSGVPHLVESVTAVPLFGAAPPVVVYEGERLQAAGAAAVVGAVGDAGTLVVVVAVSERPPSALVKAIEAVGTVHRAPRPKRGELVAWVRGRLSEHGLKVDREVPAMLVEALGTGLRDHAQAAEQLALRVGTGGHVRRADVAAHFPGVAEQPAWALYDALIAAETRKAFRVLHGLLDGGQDSVGLLFSVVSQNRMVMRAKSALGSGAKLSDGELARAIGVSPGRAAVLRRQAAHASWDWLVRLHHACAQADFELKGGDEVRVTGVLPPAMILERVIAGALPDPRVVPG